MGVVDEVTGTGREAVADLAGEEKGKGREEDNDGQGCEGKKENQGEAESEGKKENQGEAKSEGKKENQEAAKSTGKEEETDEKGPPEERPKKKPKLQADRPEGVKNEITLSKYRTKLRNIVIEKTVIGWQSQEISGSAM